MQDRADPHARERALVVALQDPPPGVSPDEAVAAVKDVLDSIGDTCPECPPQTEEISRWTGRLDDSPLRRHSARPGAQHKHGAGTDGAWAVLRVVGCRDAIHSFPSACAVRGRRR
jgi:hypothetical protein